MIKEGQKLWWVRRENKRSPGNEVTVLKVGRKWAMLNNNYRIDKDNLIADGGHYSPPGQCYLSQEAYESEVALSTAWWKFRRSLDCLPLPDGVTIENIEAAKKLLNIQG